MNNQSDLTIKVTFVKRRAYGEYSIEQLFSVLADELQKYCTIRWYELSSYMNFLRDVYSIRLQNSSTIHITGACHYIILGLLGRKTVLTVLDIGHYLYTLRGWKRYVYRLFWYDLPLRLCTHITTISSYTKDMLIEYFNIPSEKISVVPCCNNPIFQYKLKKFNSIKPRILQVGAAPHKNIFRLADALEGLNCKLMIIGKIDQATNERLKLRNIEYENIWDLDVEDMFHQYILCDFVTFVSLTEGFGLPIIEANAVGRPVITSNQAAMPEVAGDAACLVDPNSTVSIQTGILRIINDNNYRKKLVNNGIVNAERFTVEKMAKLYLDIYKMRL